MKKRILGTLALGSTVALLLSGCSSPNAETTEERSQQYTIGVVFENEAAPNTAPIREAMQQVADANGVELVMTDSKSDTGVELTDVENLVTRGVDAIIMQPVDGNGSIPASQRITEAGIPLFTVNTTFADDSGVEVESYIGQNESDAGKMQAEYMNEQLPDGGEIIFIAGTAGASWTDRRRDGFEEAINENITIAAEYFADCSRDKAMRAVEDMLQRLPAGSITGAVAQCDETAIGATLAIAASDRQSDFPAFVSVDGDPAGFEAVKEGILTATVAQDFTGQGKTAVEIVLAFLNGETVEPINATPAKLVTLENVDEFTG